MKKFNMICNNLFTCLRETFKQRQTNSKVRNLSQEMNYSSTKKVQREFFYDNNRDY